MVTRPTQPAKPSASLNDRREAQRFGARATARAPNGHGLESENLSLYTLYTK
jgi:hypothetical protein